MSMAKGTPASSQIIWLEGRVQELEQELAEVKRDRFRYYGHDRIVTAQRDKAEAELAACKADAERYRWLRDMNNDEAAVKLFSAWCGQNLDENIDAAIKVSLK